jgi:hypothetical protein
LHEQFGWMASSNITAHYFKPLAKLVTTEASLKNEENVNKHVSRA